VTVELRRSARHIDECDQCGHRVHLYNSCRNRNCPKCQAAARAEWLASARRSCCRSSNISTWYSRCHRRLLLWRFKTPGDLQPLFRSSFRTLLKIAADPKHLGASIGFWLCSTPGGRTCICIPTWHCVVPAAAFPRNGLRWIDCRKSFFLPVKVLSRLFRKKFLLYLKKAFRKGKLRFHGELEALQRPSAFEAFCQRVGQKERVVYASRRLEDPNRRSSIWPATPTRGHFQPSHRVVGGWSSHLHTPGLR